jgi:tetratricopeptide (TPR) repeat protein
MPTQKTSRLSQETQKQILTENNKADQITQLIFQSLEKPQKEQNDSKFDGWNLACMQPSILELEKDEFDNVDAVTFFCDSNSFLDETQLDTNYVLKEIAVTAATNGFAEAAFKIAGRIAKGWEQQKAYEAIIHGYIKEGTLDQAVEKCHLIEKAETCIDTLYRISTLQFAAGKKDACLNTINEALKIPKPEGIFFPNKSVARISTIQAKLGDFKSSSETISTIKDESVRALAWAFLAAEYAEKNRNLEAKDAFNKALQQAKEISYPQNRFKVLLTIIEALAKSGDFISAISNTADIDWDINRATVLDHIFSDGLPADHFGCSVCAMHGYQEEFQRITTHDKALCHIADIQAKAGDFEGAFKTIMLIGWDPLLAEALLLIGKTFANKGDIGLAQENFAKAFLVSEESGSKNQSVFLQKLALEQAKVEDFDCATTTTRFIKEAGFRIEPLIKIGELAAQSKGWNEAKCFFDEAIETAKSICDSRSRIQAFLEVAKGQTRSLGKEAAKETFTNAKNLAIYSLESDYKFFTLLTICEALAKAGEREEAIDTFELTVKLAKEKKDLRQLRLIAVKLAETGFKERAIDVSKEIVDSPKDWPYVAAVFAGQNDIKSFKKLLTLGNYDFTVAGKVAVLIAQVYSDQAKDIADMVNQFRVA